MSGRHFNLLALACICATFVAIDGPLLQRATSVRLRVPKQSPVLQISITPELPSYWSGIADFSDLPEVEIQDFQTHFIPTFYQWADNIAIRTGITGCGTRTCRATVRAPAFAVENCVSKVKHKSFLQPMSKSELKQFDKGCNHPNEKQLVFGNRFIAINGTTESLQFATLRSDQSVAKTCVGNVNETICSLVSATAEYHVAVTDGVITFPEPPSYPKIISKAKNTAITESTVEKFGLAQGLRSTYIRTTFGGIANAANIAYYVEQGLVAFPGGQERPGLAPAPSMYLSADH